MAPPEAATAGQSSSRPSIPEFLRTFAIISRSIEPAATTITGGAAVLPQGAGMTCGTVGAIGGIRAAADFTMDLFDPRRQRTLSHRYHVESLPVVA